MPVLQQGSLSGNIFRHMQDESAHCEGAAVESFVTGEIDSEARVYSLARQLDDIVRDGSPKLSTGALR